jgi:hypothetical protein
MKVNLLNFKITISFDTFQCLQNHGSLTEEDIIYAESAHKTKLKHHQYVKSEEVNEEQRSWYVSLSIIRIKTQNSTSII